MAKFIKTPVKGMCDQLPADMRLREHVLSMIKTSYSRFGFTQIETPVMEHIENLTSKQGGDNEKLIFKVMKRGADLALSLIQVRESWQTADLDTILHFHSQDIMRTTRSSFQAHSRHSRSDLYSVRISHRRDDSECSPSAI